MCHSERSAKPVVEESSDGDGDFFINKALFITFIYICVMIKKLAATLTMIFSASFADVSTQTCSGDVVDYAIQKQALAKAFKDCDDKLTSYSVSILFFKIKEGEYGNNERTQCLNEYVNNLSTVVDCFEKNNPEMSFFSIEEKMAYNYRMQNFNLILDYIRNYKQAQEQIQDKKILDAYNRLDEEVALKAQTVEDLEKQLAEAEGSREDKDILELYFKFLKAKYDWPYRCSVKPAFRCDTTWLGEHKEEFLKKYPESSYREFVETQMPGFAEMTDEEKVLMKKDELLVDQRLHKSHVEQQIAERDVWLALSGMALLGIPVTSTIGFDDNFDASVAINLAFKASWRSVVFQYQYFLAPGENNKGGSVAEKGYALMGGVMIGPKKTFTVDLLFGVSYIDAYPKDKDMKNAFLDYSSWTFAVQGSYYFPIADSWDLFAHVQARMNYMQNYCKDSFWQSEERFCTDPNRGGEPHEHDWEDLQWTFSIGIGGRFWKPKPVSMY